VSKQAWRAGDSGGGDSAGTDGGAGGLDGSAGGSGTHVGSTSEQLSGHECTRSTTCSKLRPQWSAVEDAAQSIKPPAGLHLYPTQSAHE